MAQSKFEPGSIVITPGALDVCTALGEDFVSYLVRHLRGDWGDVDEDDTATNDFAVNNDLRILSVYNLGRGNKIYIITESDRSVTTILLPSEY